MDRHARREQTRSILEKIIKDEVAAINDRRAENKRAPLSLEPATAGEHPTGPGAPALDVVALALSGGGIRSASFSLGVLQALNQHGCFPRIDYLSTVSGGGYMGASVTATMTRTKGAFVFGDSTGKRAGNKRPADVMDTPEVGHLRNYSNYLIPFGGRDFITALAIVIRGLVTNGAIVLGLMLVIVGFTILGSPTRSALFGANIFGLRVGNWFNLPWLNEISFGFTLLLSLAGFVGFLTWAIVRSLMSASKRFASDQSEFRTKAPASFAFYLVFVACVFIFELQPFVIAGMFDLSDSALASGSDDHSLITAFIKWLAAIAAPIAAVVGFFREQIATLFKSVNASSGTSKKLLALTGSAALWIGGAALPLLIWVAYLYVCYWGIIDDRAAKAPPPGAAIHGTIEIQGPGIDLRGKLDCQPAGKKPCEPLTAAPQPTPQSAPQAQSPEHAQEAADGGKHTPRWLLAAGNHFTGYFATVPPVTWLPGSWVPCRPKPKTDDAAPVNGCPTGYYQPTWKEAFEARPIMLLYFYLGIVLFLLSMLLRANANSLHRLYRDRISKAFLFDPDHKADGGVMAGDRDFAPLDTMKISDLKQPYAPYHLINAALNIEGSDFANRRGRNADFFLFSPLYIGSEATHYAHTDKVEKATSLDLPTAVAISGAAFSPNAGASSIRVLTPTLALLNVRTGYWLANPRFIASKHERPRHWFWSHFYLPAELTGSLYEDSSRVFISDGGHIENLGIYELLRRRCRVIVVADAEADPSMRFPSFIALQRYARIDLGVRINMPWDKVRQTTVGWMGFEGATEAPPDKKEGADEPPAANQAKTPSHGPHTAIGTIDYDGGHQGWLVYIKASLTGDENDYVRDYARRYDRFPHESTGDQFFSEEQFEVYRALGFHITSRLLDGTDTAQVFDDKAGAVDHNINSKHANVAPVREALLG